MKDLKENIGHCLQLILLSISTYDDGMVKCIRAFVSYIENAYNYELDDISWREYTCEN